MLEFWKAAAYYSDFRITNIARSKNAVKKNLKKYNFLHPWSNGYDPGLPNRRCRFNSGRMLKNWKIMGIGVGNYFNILERKEKNNDKKI